MVVLIVIVFILSSIDSTHSTSEVVQEEEEEADTQELWCHCQEPEYGYVHLYYTTIDFNVLYSLVYCFNLKIFFFSDS